MSAKHLNYDKYAERYIKYVTRNMSKQM